jgi:2',3'-cyclic-nucleotide 2'-phosphodiesterase (5'-nucleotidase family)
LENSVSRLPGMTAGRFLQVSGLTVQYDLSAPPGSRVKDLSIGGRPLEAGKRYSVATDSFLAGGGDGYSMFTTATDRVERQIPMRDLLLAALRAKPLKASAEGRIQFTGSGSGESGPVEHHPPSRVPMPGH